MDIERITSLVTEAQAGNMSSWEPLIEEIKDFTYYNCLKMLGQRESAEDVTQEILVIVFQKINTLHDPRAFLGWLKRIIGNQCKNQLARGNKDILLDENEDGADPFSKFEDVDEQKVPDKVIDNAETQRMIMSLIDSLSDAQRICVLMYYYDEMSVKEIASIVSVSENTIKSRLNYARKQIKSGVDEYEKQGVKLYGLSPLPFLLYFLRQNAAQSTLSQSESALLTAKIAESVAAATSGATAAGAGVISTASGAGAAAAVGKTAFFSTFAGKAVSILVAVAIAGGGGYAAGNAIQEKKTDAANQEIFALQHSIAESQHSITELQESLSTYENQTLEEQFDALNASIAENQDTGAIQQERIWQIITETTQLAESGEYDWAIRLLNNGLVAYPNDAQLLQAVEDINASRTTWLFAYYTGMGSFKPRQQSFVSPVEKTEFDSSNTFVLSSQVFGSDAYIQVPLDSQYATLSGTLCLLSYYNGGEEMRFVIMGDGKELYSRSYIPTSGITPTSHIGSVSQDDYKCEPVSIDVTGIDVITIHFHGLGENSGVAGSGFYAGINTIAELGMTDFVMTKAVN